MKTARDLMTTPVESLMATETLVEAARKLAQHDVGSMPVLDGNRLAGVVTDRDIVVKGLAEGLDPNTATVDQIATTDVVTVNADDDAEQVMKVLADHQIRRVPVVEGGQIVGVIAQADVALGMDEDKVGETVESISKK